MLVPLIPAVGVGILTATLNLGEYGAQLLFGVAAIPTNLVVGVPVHFLTGWKATTPEEQATVMVLLMVANMYVLAALLRPVMRWSTSALDWLTGPSDAKPD